MGQEKPKRLQGAQTAQLVTSLIPNWALKTASEKGLKQLFLSTRASEQQLS